MGWKMRLDVEDDRDEPPSKWRLRMSIATVIGLASLWIVGVSVLAAWLAGRVS
jgi:hypothetical protein